MKAFRISAAAVAFAAISLLAACGGGGGGGTTPPGPTSPPGPTPTPGPTATASPTPSPTPAPTPTATATATGVPVSTYTLNAQIGPQINGTQSWYTSGVTVSWTPNPGHVGQNGDTSSGANATNAFPTMDGMSCTPTVEPAASTTTYSVHSWVGIYFNGTEYALPQAIAMKNPIEPSQPVPGSTATPHPNDNYEVEAQDCEYNVHTHDYSGLVHVEDVTASQSTSTTSPLSYSPKLKSLLDLWGVQLSSTGMTVPGGTTLSGPVAVYYGNQSATHTGPHGAPVTDTYVQAVASDGSDVPLAYHTTIWIVIGNMPNQPTGDTGLPKVEWRIEF